MTSDSNNLKILHHHYHVQEGLGLIPVPCILKMKLVPPSLPRSSYVSSSFWFILQCLFRYPVCVDPLYVLQPLFLVLFYFLYYILCSCFFPNTLVFSLSSFVIPEYIHSIKLKFSSFKNLGLQVLVGLISQTVDYFMVHLTTFSLAFYLK